MNIAASLQSSLRFRLQRLYGNDADVAFELVMTRLKSFETCVEAQNGADRWDEQDAVLITYGDQISSPGETPLATFAAFLQEYQIADVLSTVHFLPFFPSSSDDGFSVVDYRQVAPEFGDWNHIAEIGKHFDLMFDFVVNHASQHSNWFQSYLAGNAPYDRFFIEAAADADVSKVTRPRSLPLLNEFETSRGSKWVWTTFSRDQVDLNYKEPQLLAEAIGILLEYVQRGRELSASTRSHISGSNWGPSAFTGPRLTKLSSCFGKSSNKSRRTSCCCPKQMSHMKRMSAILATRTKLIWSTSSVFRRCCWMHSCMKTHNR